MLVVVVLELLVEGCVALRLVYGAENLGLLDGTVCLGWLFTAIGAEALLTA